MKSSNAPAGPGAGEKLAAAGGITLLVSTFLPWYTEASPLSAWEAFSVTDLLLALTALIGVALAVLAATRQAPALPMATSVVLTALASVVLLLAAYRVLNQPGSNDVVDVRPAAYLGLAGLFLVALGSWRAVANERTGELSAPEVPARPAPPAASSVGAPREAGAPRAS